MIKNGQTYFIILQQKHRKFLKYVWSFLIIIPWSVKHPVLKKTANAFSASASLTFNEITAFFKYSILICVSQKLEYFQKLYILNLGNKFTKLWHTYA